MMIRPDRALLLGLCALLCSMPSGSGRAASPVIRIAATEGGHGSFHHDIFDTTLAALEAHFGKENVRLEFMHMQAVTQKAVGREIDFFISTGGQSRRLAPCGSRDLLTMRSYRFPDPSRSYGGLLLVRKDAPYEKLSDLRGTTLVSNRRNAFYGHSSVMAMLEFEGFRHEAFFRRQIFPDTSNTDVIRLLLEGKADVAAVTSCYLEDTFGLESDTARALRPIALSSAEPCLISTDPYPNWTISAAPGVPHTLAREVVKVLLGMPENRFGAQWSFAMDFTQTDRLLLALGSGVFESAEAWNFSRFLSEHRNAILFTALAVLMLAFYAALVNWQVRRRTAELELALREQARLQAIAHEAESRFEAQQQVGLIGQMNSMISHELRQPLSAALAYIHGLQRFVDSGELTKRETQEVLTKLASQVEKAGGIVQKVRAYARGKKLERKTVPLSEPFDAAASAFRASGRFQGKLTVKKDAAPLVRCSVMEIELAAMNLLRNAAEALKEKHVPKPAIRFVLLEEAGGRAVIRVEDNGPEITREDLARIETPLQSGKPHGLGLGLPIVRSIAASHGGKLLLEARPEGGLRASLVLPAVSAEDAHSNPSSGEPP